MKGIIRSYTGLTIAVIAAFFVMALTGITSAALSLGIFSILMISLKSWLIQPVVKNTVYFNPTRSRRIKNRRLKVA